MSQEILKNNPPLGAVAKKRERWAALDWSLQNCVLAEQLGESPTLVLYWRKKLKKPKPESHCKRTKQKPPVYENWDWSKRNIDLALEHGFSREYIRQCREKAEASKL